MTRRADDVLAGVADAWLQEVGDAAGDSIEAPSPTLQRALQVSWSVVLVARDTCTPPLLLTAPHRRCRPRRTMRASREQHQPCASSASSPTLQRAPQVFPIDRVAAASRTGRADDVLAGVADVWRQEVSDAAGDSIEASSPTLQRALQVS